MGLRDGRTLTKLGFLHIVPFSGQDPAAGLRDALDLFAYAEELGFDSGWIRTRHLQYGVPSPAVFLTALAARTERLELGSAVVPLEYENPFRLAEDLGVADLLSGGRLRPGVSVHPPRYDDAGNDAVFGAGWRAEEYGYERIERLLSLLRGAHVRTPGPYAGPGGDLDSGTVQPLSPGLAERFAYGAGSLRSAGWTGAHGLGLLQSNISSTEQGVRGFDAVQAAQIRAYRAALPGGAAGHASLARVVVPTEGATSEQLRRYTEYVRRRTPRTTKIQGERTIIAPDVLGTTEEIVAAFAANEAFGLADELLFELPFELEPADWRHLLEQLATRVGPALGWTPRG